MTWLAPPDEKSQKTSMSRGVSTYHLPASWGRRLGAAVTDGILALAIGVSVLTLGNRLDFWSLTPSKLWILGVIFIFFGIRRPSPGTRVWGIKKEGRNRFQQKEALGFLIFVRMGATLILLFALVGLTEAALLSHPLWSRAAPWQPTVNNPTLAVTSPARLRLPFFYTQALWPLNFNSQPIYYAIPYEKGPPEHFVGHIIARWDEPGSPRVRVVFEGPKTPNAPWPMTAIRDCFTKSWFSLINPQGFDCFEKKQDVLARHLREIHALKMRVSNIRWFKLPSQAEGFYLHAEKADSFQERFCFITPHGIHQTIILDRPSHPSSDSAWQVFQTVLNTLELREDLKDGQAWVNEALSKVDVRNSGEDALNQAQALLTSKISVDGKVLDSYFHLGGTAYLLAKKNQAIPREVAGTLIENMVHYSHDLAPEDPRTGQLEKMALEARRK